MASEHRLKVAINFGVTHSSVAWKHTASEDINIISQWPGNSRPSHLVPSEISCTPTGELHKWGFQIKSGEEKLSHILHLLDPPTTSSDPPAILRPLSLNPNPKTLVDVVTDYLTCLRKHIVETLKRSYGREFLEKTPIDYVLTVPNTMGDSTIKNMLHAAESAGLGDMNKIQFIPEFEAAAAWVLLRENKPDNLKLHDVFIVVDCGIDTVDLGSYEILSLNPTPTLKECCPSTGGLCGSSFINRKFEGFLERRIGKWFDKTKTSARSRVMKEFEEVLKRVFTGSPEDCFFTVLIGPVPDDPEAGIEDGELVLSTEDMKSIFDPVINEIISLVQNQIDMTEGQGQRGLNISCIILLGDFGSSKYLHKKLEDSLARKRGNALPKIEILHPLNALTACVRGASLGQTRVLNGSLISKRYYGIEVETEFMFDKHLQENLFYCSYTGKALCRRRIEWLIKQGDKILDNDPVSTPIRRRVGLDPKNDMLFNHDFFSWEQSAVPEYSNQPISNNNIEKLGTIVWDLSKVPKSLFTKITGPKLAPHYEINCDLVLTVNSDTLTFKSMFQGKEYGSVTTRYFHE